MSTSTRRLGPRRVQPRPYETSASSTAHSRTRSEPHNDVANTHTHSYYHRSATSTMDSYYQHPVSPKPTAHSHHRTNSSISSTSPYLTPLVTKQEAIDLWSNSVLLAVHYGISESLLEHTRLLSVCGNTIPRSLLHFNMGSLWSVANEQQRSIEAYEKSCNEDPTLAIAWFCLGVNNFSSKNYASALTAFRNCLSCYVGSEMVKNYESQGLDIKIEKTKVAWNIHLAEHHLSKQEGWAPPRLILENPLNTTRKDLYFDAPEIHDSNEADAFTEECSSPVSWNGSTRSHSRLGQLVSRLQKLKTSLRENLGEENNNNRDSGLGEEETTTRSPSPIQAQFQKLRASFSRSQDDEKKDRRDSGIGEETTTRTSTPCLSQFQKLRDSFRRSQDRGKDNRDRDSGLGDDMSMTSASTSPSTTSTSTKRKQKKARRR